MTDQKSLKDMADKEPLNGRPLLVKDKVRGVGKNGKSFLSLLIGDATGHMDARVWDRVEEFDSQIQVGQVFLFKGLIQVYMNRKQIVVHKVDTPEEGMYNVADFVIQGRKIDTHALFSELISIVQTVQSPHIKQLILDTLQDDEIKPLVLKTPAAKSIHHAHKGGLLEHVVSICHLMKSIAKHYNFLNEDLLIFGAIFHDLGKIWELEIENDFIQYSHRGRLLGHMYMSCELIEKKSQRILGFPVDLKDVLKHIVLSHHGKLEYGSPVRPHFMEAFMVAMIDDLDSKVDTMKNFVENERQTGESWSRFSEHFERYFYLEDLKGKWT